jgi:hypothetical protein
MVDCSNMLYVRRCVYCLLCTSVQKPAGLQVRLLSRLAFQLIMHISINEKTTMKLTDDVKNLLGCTMKITRNVTVLSRYVESTRRLGFGSASKPDHKNQK